MIQLRVKDLDRGPTHGRSVVLGFELATFWPVAIIKLCTIKKKKKKNNDKSFSVYVMMEH